VMRYLVTGRTSTRAEVWRTMATSLGSWALRGHGMWACELIDGGTFVGSVGIFQPLDWPEPEIAYSLDQPILAARLRNRSNHGGAGLVVRAFSLDPGGEFHSARQSRFETRRGTAWCRLRTYV
jgi:hypothetical protein